MSAVSATGGLPFNRKKEQTSKRMSVASCCAFQWPGHVERDPAGGSTQTQPPDVARPCATLFPMKITLLRHFGTLAHHRKTRPGPRLASRVGCWGRLLGQSGHVCLPSEGGCTSDKASPFLCSSERWGHTQVGLVDQMLPDLRQAGSSIPLPRCRSPDVSLAPHVASQRFRCGWRTQPCETGETDTLGTCQRHVA